jgi:hypothetical protein
MVIHGLSASKLPASLLARFFIIPGLAKHNHRIARLSAAGIRLVSLSRRLSKSLFRRLLLFELATRRLVDKVKSFALY